MTVRFNMRSIVHVLAASSAALLSLVPAAARGGFELEKPIDAVKKLNEDYGLHITVGKAPTSAEVSEYRRRIERRKAYEVWEKQAWRTLADYLWLMRDWRELAPKSPDEEPDRRFVYALNHIDYAEYLCGEFIDMDKPERIDMKSIIDDIADFMKRKDT